MTNSNGSRLFKTEEFAIFGLREAGHYYSDSRITLVVRSIIVK